MANFLHLFDSPYEFDHPHQLTRTLSSWDTLSFWRERLRDCLGSASPSVPPSWYGEIPESLHLNKTTADHPSIFDGKSWKAITNYVLNRPKWRQPQTTTSGGLPSLTVISANLWGQWTIQYKYYSFKNLISMLLISTCYIKPIWLKAHSKCHPMTTWNINWDWRCSPSNLQVHSELLLRSHFSKQAR